MVAPQQEPPLSHWKLFSLLCQLHRGSLCVDCVYTHTHKSYQYSQLLPQNIFIFSFFHLGFLNWARAPDSAPPRSFLKTRETDV
jgi:hypothetical protein